MSRLLMALCLSILMVGMASAIDWDNAKSYDVAQREVTISNAFGFGGDIAKVRLDTPDFNYVPAGHDVQIAELTFSSYKEYANALGGDSVRYIKGSGGSKTFTYKLKQAQVVQRDLIAKECTKVNCTDKVVGHYDDEMVSWVPLDRSAKLSQGEFTVGVFTDTTFGEVFDWVPTLYGKEVDEWAIVSVTETIAGGAWSNAALSNARGWNITIERQVNITQFILEGGVSGVTRGLIRTTDNGQTLFSTTTLVGGNPTFTGAGANLSVGNYRFLVDNNGLGYTGRRLTGESLPQDTGVINWISGANEQLTDDGFSIISIVYNISLVTISNVTLTAPANNSGFTSLSGVTFNATAGLVAGTATNATLHLYNNAGALLTTVFTDSVPQNKSNFTLTGLFGDGRYFWNIQMCGQQAQSADCSFNSSNFTFVIDSTNPIVNLPSPSNASYIYPINSTVTRVSLNVSGSDTSLAFCSYNSTFDSTLRNTPCSGLIQVNITNVFGQQTIYGFANDTLGMRTMNQTTFIIPQPSFNSTANIIGQQGFILNSSYFDGLTATGIMLTWNGTGYGTSIALDGAGNTIASATISIPAFPSGPVPFYWNTTLSNGTTLNSPIYLQNLSSFVIDDCSAGTTLIANFSNFDQDSLVRLTQNSFFNAQVRIGDANLATYQQFAGNATNKTNMAICMNVNITDSYRMDFIMQWSKNSSYFTQFYNVQNFTLTSSTLGRNYSLYNLLQSSGQVFSIVIKDSTYLPLQDAVVQIDRQYIQNGNFLTVEAPLTDNQGSTVAHLVLNNQVYNIYVLKNGQIIASFLNQQPYCNPILTDCIINYNIPGSDTNPTTGEGNGNINYAPYYNDTTRVYTVQFSSVNGSTNSLQLIGTASSGSQVCAGSQVGSSGSITCAIPAQSQNTTVRIRLYSNGELVFTDYVRVGFSQQEPSKAKYFLAGLLLPAAVLMGIGSPAIALIMFCFGLVICAFVLIIDTQAIIGVGSFIVWFIIAAVVVMVKVAKGGSKNG